MHLIDARVLCVATAVVLLIFTTDVEAARKTSGGSSSRGGGSSSRGSSSGNKYSSSAVAKPSYTSYPKQQQPLQKSSAPYPVQNSGHHPAPSAPQLPYNPAYRPGAAPVYPNQQRPPYPQYQQPNYGAAGAAPHNPYAAPSHFQQPGYGGQHYPQQPAYGGHPGYHSPPAAAQPVPQVVNNYYGGAGTNTGSGVPVVQQKSRSGPGIGTSLLAGAASGVAGAALYNALTPSRHGSSTIIREVDRPVDRVVEVQRPAQQEFQPNYNQPIMPQPGYADNSQNAAFARKSDQGPPPVYCDELPPMAPMPVAAAQVQPSPVDANNMTEPSEPVTNVPPPPPQAPPQVPPQAPPLAPGYNAALGCIVRTPYGAEGTYPQQPPFNGYWPQGGQDGFQNTNHLNQAGYAPDDRAPFVGGQQGAQSNRRAGNKAANFETPSLLLLLVGAWAMTFVKY